MLLFRMDVSLRTRCGFGQKNSLLEKGALMLTSFFKLLEVPDKTTSQVYVGGWNGAGGRLKHYF